MEKLCLAGRYWLTILLAGGLFAISCSKVDPNQQEGIVEGEEKFIPVESIIFELNGIRYTSTANKPLKDTASLQEEGLRELSIIGYGPKEAYPVPLIGEMNFYRDIYSFNNANDSIIVLGGIYAKPVNHYLSFIGESFLHSIGKPLTDTLSFKFYNYANRSNDKGTVEIGGKVQEIYWDSLGKLRSNRIELEIMQDGASSGQKQIFSLPFYEKRNKVEILGFPSESSPYIQLFPGDSLQLQFRAFAPEEFTVYEWAKGVANERFPVLNREEVEHLYMANLQNPLLTEEGKRYTDSMVSLSPSGLVKVDKGWDQTKAKANGGAVYNEIPVCIIMMPQGNNQVESLGTSVTPFFCNAVVRVVSK